MYYVYEWYIKNTNEVFYVGKGTKNRYRVTNRNQLFKDVYNNNDCDVRIIEYFENEKDAFDYEAKRIRELKQRGQCECNIMPGGAGGSGEYWTDELRQFYSDYNIMKDEKQRKRMSINNPMKNPLIAEKVAKTKYRAVIIGSSEFKSVKEAMDYYHVSYDTIASWCKKGINYYGDQCRFKDSEQNIFIGNRYNKGGCKAILYNGKTYESPIDLAKEIGCYPGTIYSWAKRGFDSNGNICRYTDDTRELVFENRHVARNKKRAKSVIINGIHYSSVDEASKLLNIPKSTLYSYLQGKKHNPKYNCTYDNQQPSQGNVA